MIDLLDKHPLGIFQLLDNYSAQSSATDDKLRTTLIQRHENKHPAFKTNFKDKNTFIVNHTACPVEYNI